MILLEEALCRLSRADLAQLLDLDCIGERIGRPNGFVQLITQTVSPIVLSLAAEFSGRFSEG